MLMFMENVDNTEDMQLFIASVGGHSASVVLESELFRTEVNVLSGQMKTVSILKELQASGVGIERKGIRISASEDIVVLGFNKQDESCGGFKVMPIDALGYNYYAMSWWPNSGDKNFGEIGVVATEDQTTVRFIVQRSKGVKFTYDGSEYNEDRPLEVMLNKYQTFQLQNVRFADITGTKIAADKLVAVFSGMLQTDIRSGRVDHVVEQMPPLHSWGKSFGVVPFPDHDSGYFIKVVASAADTTVHVNGETRRINTAGGFIEYGSSEYIGITADKPVMVAQFVQGDSGQESGAPSMVMIPPVEQYKNNYVFSVPDGADLRSYVLLVAEQGHTSHLMVDGLAVSGSWIDIPGSSPALVGVQLPMSAGLHVAAHEDSGVRFGSVVYGYGSSTCAFTYQAGMCLADIRNVSMNHSLHLYQMFAIYIVFILYKVV